MIPRPALALAASAALLLAGCSGGDTAETPADSPPSTASASPSAEAPATVEPDMSQLDSHAGVLKAISASEDKATGTAFAVAFGPASAEAAAGSDDDDPIGAGDGVWQVKVAVDGTEHTVEVAPDGERVLAATVGDDIADEQARLDASEMTLGEAIDAAIAAQRTDAPVASGSLDDSGDELLWTIGFSDDTSVDVSDGQGQVIEP